MFLNSVLGISLMSYEPIAVEIVKISPILIEIWYKMWWKSWKKRENALLENISKSYFQPFFLVKLSQSNPILGFYNKKANKCSLHIFKIRSKNVFLQKNYLVVLKLSKQKKCWKLSKFFFFTVYRMRHAIVHGNFTPIGEYSSTAKIRQK